MRQLKSFLRQTSVIFAQMPLKTFSSAISLAVFQKKSICMFDIHVSFILTINA